MSTVARRRLIRDLKKLQQDPPSGVSAAPTTDDIMRWTAVMFGPEDTPWEGGTREGPVLEEYMFPFLIRRSSLSHSVALEGTFQLEVTFSEEFPTKPPRVRFLNPMFHPNIYTNGEICLDILQNQWSPIYDIAAILTSVQSLLCDPNPNSPANSEAARLWSENRREYNLKVVQCVEDSWAVADELTKDMSDIDDD